MVDITHLQTHMNGMPMALFQCNVSDLARETDRHTDRHGDSPSRQTPAVFSVKIHESIQKYKMNSKSPDLTVYSSLDSIQSFHT